MSPRPLAILGTGLVTPVGLSAPAACAAIRAKVASPMESRFLDSAGEVIMTCPVPLAEPREMPARLARMAAMAIEECLDEVPPADGEGLPVLVCVAEEGRPGRAGGLDACLLADIEAELGGRFSSASALISLGRTGVASALTRARDLVYEAGVPRVLIAAADSLLGEQQLAALDRAGRLLTPGNSDGFLPGEAAGAILVGAPAAPGTAAQLVVNGIGIAQEEATLESGLPLRADGLLRAIRAALVEAGCGVHELDFRIADLSGERYYFKEAALAVVRVLRQSKDEFDLWHAAECTGEVGAAAALVALAVADAACRNGYAPGPGVLVHLSNDDGRRAALVLGYGD